MRVIIHRTPKKLISLRIENDTLIVEANKNLKLNQIKEIVESKREWICDHRNRQNKSVTSGDTPTENSRKDIADMFCGKTIMLNGFIYTVQFTDDGKNNIKDRTLIIAGKPYSTKEERLKALKSFVKKFSAQNVSHKISKFGSCISMCPSKIEFKKMPSVEWLKCSSPEERCITLDYRISQLPEDLQRYLIVHAFSHFSAKEHDDNFWDIVSTYLPEYKQCVNSLRDFDFLKEILQ